MDSFVYDRSLRELFQDVPKTLIKLLVGKEIKEVLDVTFPKVEERRVDLLTRLEDDTLFHLEIQSTNDHLMPKRMLKYASLIYESYHDFPLQMVLYVGEKQLKIKNSIKEKNLRYNYEVKDIREFDCAVLLESEDITDNIIAVLCNIKNIDRFFKRLNTKLLSLENSKREDYLRKIFYLLRLRPKINDLYRKNYEKELPMPFVIEKENDPLFKDGLETGREEGIKKGIKEGIEKVAKELLDTMDDETISKKTGLSLAKVKEIRAKQTRL